MKKFIRLILFSCLVLGSGKLLAQPYTLTVEVINIQEIKGSVVIAVYNKKEDFPKEGFEYRKITLKVTASVVSFAFANLPKGDYAVAVFHDKNSDGICNRNFLGIPTEGYGFSNNVRPVFSAPAFDEVKFNLDRSKTIIITLIH